MLRLCLILTSFALKDSATNLTRVVFALCTSLTCVPVSADTEGSSGFQRASAIYAAMDSTTTPATISGKFITRNFTSRDAKADSERVESRVRDWEKRFRDRDERFRKAVLDAGGTITEQDELRLKEKFEKDVAFWRKHENASIAPTTTRFCYVAVKGNKYRFEQVELPNDLPLSTLAEQIRSGVIDVESDATGSLVVTWDASESNMMTVQPPENEAGGDPKGLTRIGSEPVTPIPDFFNAGRLPKDAGATLLRAAATDGAFVGVEALASRAFSGAQAKKISISKSLPNVSPVSGFEMMTTVLPEHGYVVESEVIIVNGVELSRDIHSDFQESGTGLWFPKSVVRERYELDDNNQSARKLKSRVEYLAVYDVEFDKPLDDSLFRLRGTPQFDGLPAMNFGVRSEAASLHREAWYPMRWSLIFFTAVFWLAIAWAIKRRNRGQRVRAS